MLVGRFGLGLKFVSKSDIFMWSCFKEQQS